MAGYLLLAFPFRRTLPTVVFDVAVAAGMAVAIAGWALARANPWPMIVAAAAGSLWFGLSRRELRLPDRVPLRVDIGDPLPPFSARTTGGEAFTDADLARSAPALLVLFRGWWCPYCTTQLGRIHSEYRALRGAGLTLYALSVDRPEELVSLERRLEGTITFLSDAGGSILDSLGVRHPDGVAWYDRLFLGARRGDVAMPASLIVDRSGRIVFVHRSKRIDDRPSVAALLTAFEETAGRPR